MENRQTTAAAVQAHLAAIVASSDDGIVSKSLDGVVESWNAAAQRIFGYTADEMIGRPITLIIPPERQDEEPAILARIRRGERVEHFRTTRIRKDGRRILVSATISPIKDETGRIIGASKIVRDVTRVVELEGLHEAIVASSDDGIVSKDLTGTVKTWNEGAQRIFGYSAAEMIGRSITTIIPPDRLGEEDDILARIRRGERLDHFETVRRRKDGRLIDVSVSISPLRAPTGEVIGASKIARDITVSKAMLAERERLLASEQAARQEAERVNRLKDEFLATLSHELRTPLNAILGWAQMLRSGGVSPQDAAHGLETIERNARAQTQLIEELLDVSRIITGKLRLDVQRVDLASLIAECVDSIRPAAEGKQQKLHRVLDPNAGPVMGDPNRLRQVIWNLLTNAVKYTPKGGSVQVYLQRINSHIEITVSDTGIGIPADFLPRLFTRFAQADASTTRQQGGLGIGLAIVRHLVELHGGVVYAKSLGEGQGSTFVVSLPLSAILDNRPPREARHPTHTHSEAPVIPTLAGVTALVVDDEPDSRLLMQKLLQHAGAAVLTASSATEALGVLPQQRIDVLVSDIGMPDEDGYQLLRRVRALPASEGGSVPAVAVTAFARSEDRQQALLAGFQLHLSKPVEPAELVTVVAQLARRSPGRG